MLRTCLVEAINNKQPKEPIMLRPRVHYFPIINNLNPLDLIVCQDGGQAAQKIWTSWCIWLCAVLCIFGVFNWSRLHEARYRNRRKYMWNRINLVHLQSVGCVRTPLRNKSVFNVFALNFDIHFMSLGSHSVEAWRFFFLMQCEVKNEISDPVCEIIIFTSCYWTPDCVLRVKCN